MDHPEPISKHPMDIPQCRKNFTLEEARSFIDKVMEVFRTLEDMSDLRSMYETGKQLSRAYFDCHSFRAELAQYLTNCDYPAFASKMMKKLNNMGVFKNDDIWFSSFYFYNTTWNFSDTWPEFATALATASLPNLLNLNIGHQPYLENLSSKNVYYLIKASLSIIHNIARVPGNTHYFTTDAVRQALIHLSQREEDFLRCVSALCLSHIITESETQLVTDTSSNGLDLLRALFGYITAARVSEKRRCHGFQVAELLTALSAFSVHDTVKSTLLTANLPSSGPSGQMDSTMACFNLIKDLVDVALLASPSSVALREAEEVVRIAWNLTVDPSLLSSGAQTQMKSWVYDVINNPAASNQLTKAMLRALEAIQWKLAHPIPAAVREDFVEGGSILFSFSPSNRIAVTRIADRLREANLPVMSVPFGTEAVGLPEACLVGLSMNACTTSSRSQWFDWVDRASIMIVCLSDAYRLNPGCRLEAEHFLGTGSDTHTKPVISILLQPRLKPTGWLSRLSTRHPIDFNGKRDPELSFDTLISQLKELVSETKRRTEAAVAAAAAAAQRHSSMDSKRHMATAGDIGLVGATNVDSGMVNHLPNGSGASTTGASRAASGMSVKRDDPGIPYTPFAQKSLNPSISMHALSGVGTRPIISPTCAWRHVVRPEVRDWSTTMVATWLRFRGLGHISANMAGGIDGVLLSQLAGLRFWAPEYFNQCVRNELVLGFTESLRFLEALDELAPGGEEEKKSLDPCDAERDFTRMTNVIDGPLNKS